MRQFLAAHRLKADFRKLGGVFINDQGVEYYKSLLKTSDSSRSFYIEADIASQLLKSGQTEEAIDIFSKLLKKSNRQNNFKSYPPNLLNEIKKLLALSYLRLGEQKNCIINHNAESCIIPLSEKGIYKIKEPIYNAIKLYSEIVSENKNDLESKWLLNISYMTLGLYPDSVPYINYIPLKTFDRTYEYGKFIDRSPDLKLDLQGLSGSVILDDFDNDNDLDIFYVRLAFDSQCHYFLNNGDGSFTDKTLEAGFLGEVSGRTCIQADFNNDGFLDIFIVRGAWEIQEDNLPPSSLMRNNGDGSFTDVTIESGLLDFRPNYNACWLDYDNDGWVDLFLSNESADDKFKHPTKLYHNNRNGNFEEVSEKTGVKTSVWTKGVVSFDYNNDGWQDIYLCTINSPNILYKNNGKNKDSLVTFTNVSEQAKVGGPSVSFYTLPLDYNNDGWMDLYASKSTFEYGSLTSALVSDYLGKGSNNESHAKLYKNNKDGTFTDVAEDLKLNRVIYNMGINSGDIDNDGFPDIYAGTGNILLNSLFPNLMLRNKEGKYFEDVSASSGVANLQHGHGVAFGDIDNDGDQDIYQVMGGNYSGDLYQNVLYENPGSPNHWIKLKLEGVQSNRAAIGARIKLNIQTAEGSKDIYSTVSSGGSFGASTLRREIGIGSSNKINYIEVKWPGSGATQTFKNMNPDKLYKITEGNNLPSEIEIIKFKLGQGEINQMKH